MRLSDIMSNMGLALYPQLALILFLVAFALICARVLLFSSAKDMHRAAHIPLSNDEGRGAERGREERRS
jgi:hypothetical protein